MNTYEEELTGHMAIDNRLQKRNGDGWTRGNKIALIIALLIVVLVFVCSWAGDQTNLGVAFVYAFFAVVGLKWILSRRKLGWGRRYEEVGHILRGWLFMRKGGHHRALPISIAVINARDVDGVPYRIPLQHHLDRQCDQLFIRARGGAFASLEGMELLERNQALADVFDRSLNMTDLHAGIACLSVSAPANDADFTIEMATKGSPLLMASQNFKLDEAMQTMVDRQQEYLDQLFSSFHDKGARENWGLIVVTIHHGGGWKGIKKGGLDNDELDNLPVLELGRSLVEGLRANELLGLSDIHILKPTEHFLLTRASWDVFGILPFYDIYNKLSLKYLALGVQEVIAAQEEKGDEPLTEQEIAAIEVKNDRLMLDKLKTTVSCWPKPDEIVSVNKHCLRMGDNYISVLRIDETPKTIPESEYLNQLRLVPLGEWARRCYGGEAISGDVESASILVQQAQATSWLDALTSQLNVPIPKVEAAKQELAAKSRIASRYSIAQLSSKYWAIVTSSAQTNKAQMKKFKGTLRARGFKTHVVKRPVLHIDAFLTAALGAARM